MEKNITHRKSSKFDIDNKTLHFVFSEQDFDDFYNFHSYNFDIRMEDGRLFHLFRYRIINLQKEHKIFLPKYNAMMEAGYDYLFEKIRNCGDLTLPRIAHYISTFVPVIEENATNLENFLLSVCFRDSYTIGDYKTANASKKNQMLKMVRNHIENYEHDQTKGIAECFDPFSSYFGKDSSTLMKHIWVLKKNYNKDHYDLTMKLFDFFYHNDIDSSIKFKDWKTRGVTKEMIDNTFGVQPKLKDTRIIEPFLRKKIFVKYVEDFTRNDFCIFAGMELPTTMNIESVIKRFEKRVNSDNKANIQEAYKKIRDYNKKDYDVRPWWSRSKDFPKAIKNVVKNYNTVDLILYGLKNYPRTHYGTSKINVPDAFYLSLLVKGKTKEWIKNAYDIEEVIDAFYDAGIPRENILDVIFHVGESDVVLNLKQWMNYIENYEENKELPFEWVISIL